MRKDTVVASADFDESGNMLKFSQKDETKELLPLQERLAPDSLKRWWSSRAVPVTQGGVREMLTNAGLDFPEEYLLKNLGLSLTDYYWIKPVDSGLTWNKVNLYDNDFAENHLTDGKRTCATDKADDKGKAGTQGDTCITGSAGSTSSYSPNSTLQGQLEKSWIIRNGERFLLKGNRDFYSSESINEVIATELHKRQGRSDYCEYRLAKIKGRPYKYGCISKAFTSKQLELVSAFAVITSEKKSNNTNNYEHFLNVCEKHGMDKEKLRADMEYMILSDYVLSNRDRHLNNIAILRDAETLEFVSLAPFFDTGKSMFVGRPVPNKEKEFKELETNSFVRSEKKMLEFVTDKTILDISKLPSPEWIKKTYMKDSYQEEGRVDAICRAYEMKVGVLERMQK